MEVYVPIYHHQHQIIDLVVTECTCERLLDITADARQFGATLGADITERLCNTLVREDQRAQGRLLRPQQHT